MADENLLLNGSDSDDDLIGVSRDSSNVIELDNIHKTYLLGIEGIAALRGVSLNIKKGEWVSIFGPSGSGKTTMLNIVGTIDKPTKGTLVLDGVRITSNTTDEVLAGLRRNRLGFVFQTFNLLSSMVAEDNVGLPQILAGQRSASDRETRSHILLERVRMSHRSKHKPSMLSGGEQQRVTIARAIANQPAILLLDEPTGDLDSGNTNMVMELLHELNVVEGITMVMVTHDVSLKNFAHRVVWMRDGKIQRVEHISEKKRTKRLNELHADLEKAGLKTQFLEKEKDDDHVTAASGAQKSDALGVKAQPKPVTKRTMTEVRLPESYGSFQHVVKNPENFSRLRHFASRNMRNSAAYENAESLAATYENVIASPSGRRLTRSSRPKPEPAEAQSKSDEGEVPVSPLLRVASLHLGIDPELTMEYQETDETEETSGMLHVSDPANRKPTPQRPEHRQPPVTAIPPRKVEPPIPFTSTLKSDTHSKMKQAQEEQSRLLQNIDQLLMKAHTPDTSVQGSTRGSPKTEADPVPF